MTHIFDSRDSRYKTPYGAVPCGTQITVTLRPPRAEGFSACDLLLFEEFSEGYWETPLSFAGEEGDRAVFTGSCSAPEQPELIWYGFRLRRENGEAVWLGKKGFCAENEITPWQQTVYDDSLPTPDWFGRGVTYQIFPDRFRRTRIPNPAGMTGDRLVHQEWEEGMEYLPDEKGEIRNRDFFGGNLTGVEEKLNYLKAIGVTTLYFCPVFEADSNHRYNTGDYEKIDPMLGTERDFRSLCRRARKLGMRVMLDGVFNHTGSNSKYFNANGEYPDLGAAQSRESPYYPWYTFLHWPERYDAWWGIRTLPAVNETHPSYVDYIVRGENSIIRRWLRLGADAWRLDVADELPLPGGGLGLPPGGRRGGLRGGHGDDPGELPPLRLLQRHEPAGHPRHSPDSDPPGDQRPRAAPGPDRPGQLPDDPGGAGEGGAAAGDRRGAAIYLPGLAHGLLRG